MLLRSLVLVLVTLVFWPSSASATSCAMPTPDATPQYSDVIFEAVAEKELAVDGGRSRYTSLSVNKVYRGEVPKKVAALHGGMKGYPPFILGRKYLVFASLRSTDSPPSKFGPTVFVHLCHATHLLPRQDHFAKGPWTGFDPVKSFGAARAPGAKLVGARPGQPTPIATPSAPLPKSPQPDAQANSGSGAKPHASTSSRPPGAAPPPTEAPPASRGCGCVLGGRGASSRAGWWFALLAAFLVPTRRRSKVGT